MSRVVCRVSWVLCSVSRVVYRVSRQRMPKLVPKHEDEHEDQQDEHQAGELESGAGAGEETERLLRAEGCTLVLRGGALEQLAR